jgi:hypothetical protein
MKLKMIGVAALSVFALSACSEMQMGAQSAKCGRRSESDTRWRRRSEMRNDSCSAGQSGACC